MSQKGRWARTDVCRRAGFLWITEPDRLPVKVPCHESRGLGTAPQAQASVAEPVQHGMHGWTGDVQSIDCSLPTSDHEDEHRLPPGVLPSTSPAVDDSTVAALAKV